MYKNIDEKCLKSKFAQANPKLNGKCEIQTKLQKAYKHIAQKLSNPKH